MIKPRLHPSGPNYLKRRSLVDRNFGPLTWVIIKLNDPSRTEFWWFHQVAAGLCPICTAACVLQYRISCSSMCDLFMCYVWWSAATKIAKMVWSHQLYLVIWEFVIWVQHQIWTFTSFNHSRLKFLKCDSNMFLFAALAHGTLDFLNGCPKK
jgi:hypothetical protein